MNKKKVTTICYGREREWDSREDAIKFFWQGVLACEGSERDRYINIVAKLQDGYDVANDDDLF